MDVVRALVGVDGLKVLAVAHDSFRKAGPAEMRRFGRDPHVVYDLKHVLDADASDLRL